MDETKKTLEELEGLTLDLTKKIATELAEVPVCGDHIYFKTKWEHGKHSVTILRLKHILCPVELPEGLLQIGQQVIWVLFTPPAW